MLDRHRIVRVGQPTHPPGLQLSGYGDDQQIHDTPAEMLLTKRSPPTVLPRREDETSGDTQRAPADRRTTQSSLPLPRIHLVIRSHAVSAQTCEPRSILRECCHGFDLNELMAIPEDGHSHQGAGDIVVAEPLCDDRPHAP